MSWYERPYADDSHGGRRGFADNPLNWAPTLGHLAGIRIRVHILFILFIVFELLRARGDIAYRAHAMFILFGSVFLHEMGHCFAARRVGGRADDILMWPLGGLASVDAPRSPWPQFVTVICGPLVNLVIYVATWLILHWTSPATRLDWYFGAGDSSIANSWGNPFAWLGLSNEMNLWMFLFNLWPMYPMDGGRLLHCALWRRLGWAGAMRITTTVGMIAAVLLGLAGMIRGEMMMIAIAFMGYIECMRERVMLRAGAHQGQDDFGTYAAAYEKAEPQRPRSWLAGWRRRRLDARRRREQEAAAAQQADVDRILSKVHNQGLHSLTRGERRTLESATRRERQRQH